MLCYQVMFMLLLGFPMV